MTFSVCIFVARFRRGLEDRIVGLEPRFGEELFQVHFLVEERGDIGPVDLVDKRDLLADLGPRRRALDLLDHGPLGIGFAGEVLVHVENVSEHLRCLVEIERHLVAIPI